jgi:S-formylglutathione hydrolase FrmB
MHISRIGKQDFACVFSKILISIIFPVLIVCVFAQEALSMGKIITDQITSDALKDNKLGDTNTRDMVIYLPPSYDSSDKHYPVIYLLHGFGGNERSYVDTVTEQLMVFLLDGFIQSGIFKEFILVMPNAKNKYGGSYYLNSELIGNYEDYVVNEVVNHIDTKYRTIRDRDGCAIAGASMGGYGSITLAMKHPNVFSSVAALGPPLSFDKITDFVIPEILNENPNGMIGPNSNEQYSDFIYALSAALSPNLNNPPFFVDLPFEYPTGKVIEPIRQKWMKQDPLIMLSVDNSPLKAMKGIYIDVGDDDLLGFKAAADEFHKKLLSLGIEHEYNIFEGKHADKGVERAISALMYLSGFLPDPEFPSVVESQNKLASTWGKIKYSQPLE